MKPFRSLVDGGYLSFMVGAKFGNWDQLRFTYRGSLILMDHHTYRKDIFPEYKAHRKLRRQDPDRDATYQRVSLLREAINQDTLSRTLQVYGAEADDLLGLFGIMWERDILRVIAVDKDLNQIEAIRGKLFTLHGDPVVPKMKASKYAVGLSQSFPVLYQALFGDKSDSIPRLLPSKFSDAKDIIQDILDSGDRAFYKAYEFYGEALMLNLALVLLPGPYFLGMPGPKELLWLLTSQTYWTPEVWKDWYDELVPQITDADDQADIGGWGAFS